jgi:hypothetical protein
VFKTSSGGFIPPLPPGKEKEGKLDKNNKCGAFF